MNAHNRLFFFGDSICFGQGVSIHKGWVPRIAAQLEGLGFSVANASVNGNTTRQALERMPYEIQNHRPDGLVVQFGMNDCNYWETDMGLPRVSKPAFIANLREIVDRGLAFGARCIFVHTNHPTTRCSDVMPHTRLTYEKSNREYNQAIRDHLSGYRDNVILVDIEEEFHKAAPTLGQLSKLLMPDQLHLSEAGHDLYFEMVSPIIAEALKRTFQLEGES